MHVVDVCKIYSMIPKTHPNPRQIRSMSTPYSCAIAQETLSVQGYSMDPFTRQGTHTTVSRRPTVLRTSLQNMTESSDTEVDVFEILSHVCDSNDHNKKKRKWDDRYEHVDFVQTSLAKDDMPRRA